MPKVSLRSESIPDSPFRLLIPYAEAAKAKGIHVYHLNIGQPDIHTPAMAMESIRKVDAPVLEYGHALGNHSYRAKMCSYYKKFDVDVSQEDIIITQGASEALFFVLQACLNVGENVLVPEPFYANYSGFAGMGGIQIKPLTSYLETGFALPPIDVFEAAIDPKTRAIMINNPANPTGTVYPETVLHEIAALVRKYDLFLIVDEVYREFCFGDTPFYSALRLQGIEDHVVVVDSISKRYSACGARTGAVISRNANLMSIIGRYGQQRISPGFFGQVLGEALLDLEDQYFEKVKEEYNRRRMLVFQRLQQMAGVKSYLPEGAFYCFAELPVDDAFEFCKWLLSSFSTNKQTLMLSHGSAFYATKGLGKKEARIAYVLGEQDLGAAMDCLEEALLVYPGRTA